MLFVNYVFKVCVLRFLFYLSKKWVIQATLRKMLHVCAHVHSSLCIQQQNGADSSNIKGDKKKDLLSGVGEQFNSILFLQYFWFSHILYNLHLE